MKKLFTISLVALSTAIGQAASIPISGLPQATNATEDASIPIIQKYPGRSTNDTFRISVADLFKLRHLLQSTNITSINGLFIGPGSSNWWGTPLDFPADGYVFVATSDVGAGQSDGVSFEMDAFNGDAFSDVFVSAGLSVGPTLGFSWSDGVVPGSLSVTRQAIFLGATDYLVDFSLSELGASGGLGLTTAGDVILSHGGATRDTTNTSGFVLFPLTAGAPTGTPEVNPSFYGVPVIFDSTDKKLYAYFDGFGWKDMTGGLPVSASPTAQVGLSAVNGSAPTFMTSDSAPALDQGIAPHWSGLHVFDNIGGGGGRIAFGGSTSTNAGLLGLDGSAPLLSARNGDNTADVDCEAKKLWAKENVAFQLGASGSYTTGYGSMAPHWNTSGWSTTGTGSDETLHFYNLPANSFQTGSGGERLILRASGTFAANGNNKQVKLKVGSIVVADSGNAAMNGGSWVLSAEIINDGSGTQLCSGTFQGGNTTVPMAVTRTSGSETVSSAIAVALVGKAAASDITAFTLTSEFSRP